MVVGSVNVDLVVSVPALPAPGETVIGGRFARGPGGKGGNAAVAAAALGARAAIVGCVGDDEFGPSARDDLERAGVDCTWLHRSNAATGVAAILVDAAGENLIAVASGANERLSGEAAAEAVAALAGPRTAVLANLEVPDEAVAAAARAAREHGCRFVLNPAPARPLADSLLSLCDVVTPNEHEVGRLGREGVDGLLAAGAGAVVVTRGAAGADVHRPGAEPVRQPAFPADVVDTTGAGDAFSAGLAVGLAEGRALDDAVRLAAAAGAVATAAPGARGSLPERAAVERLVAEAAA